MKALMSTQVAITLSLNVVTKTDDDTHLVTLPIIPVTRFIFWFWMMWQTIQQIDLELTQLVTDITEKTNLLLKVLTITLTALAFGLGVKL